MKTFLPTIRRYSTIWPRISRVSIDLFSKCWDISRSGTLPVRVAAFRRLKFAESKSKKVFFGRKKQKIFLSAIFSVEDSIVQMDMYSLHFNEKLWGPVDPNLFHPERHQEKRSRLAFGAFGAGPKSCVGQKFAIFIVKLTLLRILVQFEVHRTDRTEKLFNIQERSTTTPTEVWIRLERRKEFSQI